LKYYQNNYGGQVYALLSMIDCIKASQKTIATIAIGKSMSCQFVSFIKYKCERYGKKLLQIGQYVASSKICSKCRSINNELQLSDREWKCSSCGIFHDRDVNAANNIIQFGQELPEYKALLAA
jgi:hypothetical protein